MKSEFQKISRRDKKEITSSVINAKKIEENITMGKTRDFPKKIRDAKGTFHEKMGTIKDRNSRELTETEDIKAKWQFYTEELYKKIFTTQIITMVCSLT